MKKTKQKKKKLFNSAMESIELKTIRKFVLIVGITLFIMWALEILFFNVFYENIKLNELYSATDKALSIYLENNSQEQMSNYSLQNNMNIIIIKKESDNNKVLYSTYDNNESNFVMDKIDLAFTQIENKESVIYKNDDSIVVSCFKHINKEEVNYYVYTETIYLPLTSTNEVFMRLLFLSSLIAFVVAVFFSYYFSKSISKPIQNISKQAQQLTNGNLDISFSTDGYREVNKLSETLNFAVKEIKKSQVLQKEVIGNISHELKTPLTMIQSYAELINDISGDDKEKRQEHLGIILEETKRLDYLVDDIMQYSKLESGMVEFHYEKFDLISVVKKLENFYKDKYSKNGFRFDFSYPKNPLIIYADKNRIEQVIINLINNAINYSTQEKLIKVFFIENDNIFRFIVKDYGMGISKEDLKYIFDKHFRSVGAKRVSVGSGIGLSICKSILLEHKYNFGVDSEVGKGSTFYIDFIKSNN